MGERPSVAFLAWGPVEGRSAEIAAALGGESRCWYDRRLRGGWGRWRTLLRYALSAPATVAYLVTRRPRAVIATNPPTFVGLIAYGYGWATRTPVLLDSHPSSFGRKGSRVWARMLPVHAWLARRVQAVLVTTDELADVVRRWGGRAICVHEAPGDWVYDPSPTGAARPRVLFVSVMSTDEPIAAVVDAARLLPEVDVLVTGDPTLRPACLREGVPANVTLTGYLDHDRYHEAVHGADLVLALTTEPTSVMRCAYEAVYAGRPLLVSDWPALRPLFPYATFSANDPTSLAAAIRRALNRGEQGRDDAAAARRVQEQRWQAQRDAILTCIGQHLPPGPVTPTSTPRAEAA